MLQDLSRGDKVAAGGGIALLIGLFLPWFKIDLGDTGLGGVLGDLGSFNAFEVMDFMDIVLLVLAVGTVGLVVASALGKIDRSLRRYIETAGVAAVIAVVLQIFTNGFDDGINMSYGIFVSLLAAIAIAVGGYFNRTDGTV